MLDKSEDSEESEELSDILKDSNESPIEFLRQFSKIRNTYYLIIDSMTINVYRERRHITNARVCKQKEYSQRRSQSIFWVFNKFTKGMIHFGLIQLLAIDTEIKGNSEK